ncbi:LTA synthase family protein [Mucilaginibacter sp. FT3.2]|uniref:LTA synthase family protein n=1 Tax=Mucilaginibacter sp. FT3.2 TaxID=2723090 RepID=UPI001608EB2C|nr:LTA synthase family protein [Mucilaginibacter sp. FT3.2]MBB6235008.1 phosphoglycerol transferase MdoB-like AlkP superfamily enzyme [Mucilaginibacter sp. FT3.2]
MLRSFFSFCRFFIFWIILAMLTRVVFEIYFHNKLLGTSFHEILQTFQYGFLMDASVAAYISSIPLLIFCANWLTKWHIGARWLQFYVYLAVVIIAVITVVNLNIFREWGTKVNFRAFDVFFNAPSEAFAASSSSPLFLTFVLFVALIAIGIFLSKYIIDFDFKKPAAPIIVKPVIIALLLGLNLLIIRGGLQVAPIAQSNAYFSPKPILNQSALNTEWNLIQNVVENLESPGNPYVFMPAEKAAAMVDSMYAVKKDSTVHILNTNRPNVVIFQLESFTADLIESLGGEKGDAPNFEDFIKQGVLFDSVYAASDRTDKGIVAIMSAFPSQATRTIIIDNEKQERLPALSSVFADQGYRTSYFYGGESEFMNFKAYLLSHKITDLVDKKDFEEKDMNSKWGAHDDILFKRNISYFNKVPTPFFSYVQTLSNHEPFELPVPPHFPGDDMGNKFRSTAYYTDASLKEYFDAAKKQSWYKNTLFILVADHGHRLPLDKSEPYEPRKYHIPILFFGDAIKPEYRGLRIKKLGNQTDIAATLLAQLGLPHKQFKWSKDLLNPYTQDFAFFDWDNGMGFMLPNQAVTYDNAGGTISFIQNKKLPQAYTDKTLLHAKAFMQQVFTDYLK